MTMLMMMTMMMGMVMVIRGGEYIDDDAVDYCDDDCDK